VEGDIIDVNMTAYFMESLVHHSNLNLIWYMHTQYLKCLLLHPPQSMYVVYMYVCTAIHLCGLIENTVQYMQMLPMNISDDM